MSLAEIDEEIKRLTKRIERIQREERDASEDGRSRGKLGLPPQGPVYKNLPDLKDVKVPKGFERAPITHDVDPEKAIRLKQAEDELKQALLAANREEILARVRKIRKHQSRNPLGKPVTVREEQRDNLRELILNN